METLYYPFKEIRDKSWLLSAMLFWDGIYTITRDVSDPYDDEVCQELARHKFLKPYRLNPDSPPVVGISETILDILTAPYSRQLLGEDNWLARQAPYVHSDKIAQNLKYALRELFDSEPDSRGLYVMPGGVAALYMLVLSGHVASELSVSRTTDHPLLFRAVEEILSTNVNGIGPYRMRRPVDHQEQFFDGCVTELIFSWFRLDPETSPSKVLGFRTQYEAELHRFRKAVLTRVPSLLDMASTAPREELQRSARELMRDTVRPALTELRHRLRESRIGFLPDTVEAALYSEVPGVAAATAGGATWALLAAPALTVAVRTARFGLERRSLLLNCPWSYLYRVQAEFAEEQVRD